MQQVPGALVARPFKSRGRVRRSDITKSRTIGSPIYSFLLQSQTLWRPGAATGYKEHFYRERDKACANDCNLFIRSVSAFVKDRPIVERKVLAVRMSKLFITVKKNARGWL